MRVSVRVPLISRSPVTRREGCGARTSPRSFEVVPSVPYPSLVIDQPHGVIDLFAARATRLRRRAAPLGIEILVAEPSFALYGPDRRLYLYRGGLGRGVRWLTYDEAVEVLEGHITAP